MTRKIINVGRGYSGREKQKLYHYDKNGNFIKVFDSHQDLRKEYFQYIENKRPLFNNKRWKIFKYDKLPDETFYSNYRIGRDNLLKNERIFNSKLCVNNSKDEKVVEMYNLENVKIAEFKSSYIASIVTGIDLATIQRAVLQGKKKPKNDFYFKLKNDTTTDNVNDLSIQIVDEMVLENLIIDCTDTELENEFKSQDIIREKLCKFLNIKYE